MSLVAILYTYDPDKDAENRRLHSLSLADGVLVIERALGEVEDTRMAYGQNRIKAYAFIAGRLLAAVYTMRGEVHRIISVYPVKGKEARIWQNLI
jgi:uncharacterized DUF497 family protein